MVSVEAIYTAPVKSLGLTQPKSVQVGSEGIIEDRRLHLIDSQGTLLTQRQAGPLVQIHAEYKREEDRLTLEIPGSDPIDGRVELGSAVVTTMWGRPVPGKLVEGPWSAALSDFCGQPVLLVKSDRPGQCFDEYPVSLTSQGSIDFLVKQYASDSEIDKSVVFEGRRFRPNFLLAGCEPHEEDEWIGGVIRIGPELILEVVSRDPRCAITTLDPDTGLRDVDTLRQILKYRPNARAAYFGVYAFVVRPGVVNLGDEVVTPLPSR